MKLQLKANAATLFYRSIPPQCGLTEHQQRYGRLLSQLNGAIVTVETEYVFDDQYNIVENNLRVHDDVVERVIDDERAYTSRCQYCGKTQILNAAMVCLHCRGTLQPFVVNTDFYPGLSKRMRHNDRNFALTSMTTENANYDTFMQVMCDCGADVLFHENGVNVYVLYPKGGETA